MKERYVILIATVIFSALLSASAFADEFKVLEVSKNGVYCQLLNYDLECQLLDNQISVTIRSDVKEMDADLQLNCGSRQIKAYASVCNHTGNVYKCYFSLEPLIDFDKASALECSMNFYFYKKLSNESIGSDKYEGKFMITPLSETSLLSLSKQKTKLRNDFIAIKNFDMEAVYNSGICSYLGTGIFFSRIGDYENEFKTLGGLVAQAQTTSARSVNLLSNSSVLASVYAENGDFLFEMLLENFLLHGLHTGSFISDILYHLKEGYITGSVFENMQSDVDASCAKIQNNFNQLLNPNFLVMQKMKLLDCLEKKDFKNCWKKLAEMENYVNPSNSPQRAELRFYVGNRLMRDNSNLCNDSSITIAYSEMERYGVDKITVKGEGRYKPCNNTINLDFTMKDEYTVSEFLCGEGNEPADGKRYAIEIDPGAAGSKIAYNVNYYADPENCRVQQEVIPV